ncbi:Imidazolonepropionase [Robiginitalea myxolifaciens]|uniref:Imidazolonepropionase n=1 Tax=Robiginitalea myxolifaciens TaxID=400055 RepID=A0A1I6FNE2_9FLAO|nr:amidohydrolase family protein [Robiginitalea myxolifaciens]SFR31455.1 Imidazolonepropionase [Robiginitalea myxolifaciens]
MKWKFFLPAIFLSGMLAYGQEYYPKNDGVKAENDNYTALTGATLHIAPGEVIQNGTLLIRNGEVAQAGASVRIPANAVVFDLKGKHIYPSFIDVFSEYGIAKPKRAQGGGRSADYNPSREGFYWNDHIRPEQEAINAYSYDDKSAGSLRKLGFGTVNSHIPDGVARGTGVTLSLNKEGNENTRVIQQNSGQYFSFQKSVTSRQSYPSSLMGAMALLRQMYYDARWYEGGNSPTTDRALEALNSNKGLVQFFAAGDNGNVLRADGIGDNFGVQYIILAGGREYEDVQAIKATNAALVLPLDFPAAFDVSNPFEADLVSLEDMRHWNQAPSNPKVMADNGVRFAFTLHGLKNNAEFHKQIRKAISYGLSEQQALEALTTTPASLLGQSDKIGSLRPGRLANFLITSGPVFSESSTLYENWVRGQRHILSDMDQKDIRGTYSLRAGSQSFTMELSGKAAAPKLKISKDTTELKGKLSYKGDWIDLSFTDGEDRYRMTGRVSGTSDNIQGPGVLPNGRETRFTARKTAAYDAEKEEAKKSEDKPTVMPVMYPNVGYGFETMPTASDILFRNATVWTSEDAGILENTDVLVRDGKIARIGQDLNAGRAQVIDATGKHLTAGIIDEHSHIAALAINEGGHNSSAEVKMTDVIDPRDMDIYRNLAGGVTTIQLLHGSANPIGGRSAILRLRWGNPASGLIFEDMPKFIKFALGENVKQSNWGSRSRFPQTRMGVEQVFINYFQRAKEYQAQKASGNAYRYDEEMEVLAEILNGERFISCHSYVQSEINMLMKVAEQMGFRVNTFTHILEGYKVADKMAEHGVGGSTFSDWWAYKYEVKDAIPYNAAIMHNAGVTVAINSDDAEMSRRLNQEAAKTVKYGGMSEADAWKTVTINPAKLLHLDDRVGSIKEGKDADLVLWNNNPLSVYARAEKTYIQGVAYFDMERDQQLRERVANERNTLIQMMLDDKDGGKKRMPANNRKERMHCDSE